MFVEAFVPRHVPSITLDKYFEKIVRKSVRCAAFVQNCASCVFVGQLAIGAFEDSRSSGGRFTPDERFMKYDVSEDPRGRMHICPDTTFARAVLFRAFNGLDDMQQEVDVRNEARTSKTPAGLVEDLKPGLGFERMYMARCPLNAAFVFSWSRAIDDAGIARVLQVCP